MISIAFKRRKPDRELIPAPTPLVDPCPLRSQGTLVDFSGELKEVIQLVEEVMRRMREIYGADREIGDMSLGSITQFVYRKLR